MSRRNYAAGPSRRSGVAQGYHREFVFGGLNAVLRHIANTLPPDKPPPKVTKQRGRKTYEPNITDAEALELLRRHAFGHETLADIACSANLSITTLQGWWTGNNRARLREQIDKELFELERKARKRIPSPGP